jgi:hypothetical protein
VEKGLERDGDLCILGRYKVGPQPARKMARLTIAGSRKK